MAFFSSKDLPNVRPVADFNFAATKVLDNRINFSRGSGATYTDEMGVVRYASHNVPRFDHDPTTGECLGLLIEESRTNDVAHSDLGNAVWVIDGGAVKTVNTTDTKAPDGSFTALKLASQATSTSYSQIYDTFNKSSGGVQSLWAKKGTHNVIGIYDFSGGAGIRGWFDVNTGEHRCEGGSKVAAGVQSNGNDTNHTNMIEYPNGWYRCIYYEAANMTYAHFRMVDFDSDSEASSASNTIYLWGAQAEVNKTFATSFIPSLSATMPATNSTREEDRAVVKGEKFKKIFDTGFNSLSALVDYDNIDTVASGTSNGVFHLWGEALGYDNRITISSDNDTANTAIRTRAFGGGGGIFANNDALSASNQAATQKFAFSWSVPDYSNTSSRRWAFSFSGEDVDVVSNSTGTSVPQLTRLGLGINPTRLDEHGGKTHFKRVAIYNKVLSDEELKGLSAI